MKFKVTQEHIKNGQRYWSGKCPVALSIKHRFPNSEVSVCCQYKDEIVIGDVVIENVPKEVRQFVHSFDNGLFKLEPFEFELDI